MDEKYARHGGDYMLKFDDIVTELKAIYVQCGGEASAVANVTTVEGMLDKVEEVAGSGGGGAAMLKCTATIVNSYSGPPPAVVPMYFTMGTILVDDVYLGDSSTAPVIFPQGSTEYEFLYYKTVLGDPATYTICINDSQVNVGVTFSDFVNCSVTVDGDMQILQPTDPTIDSSVTITLGNPK